MIKSKIYTIKNPMLVDEYEESSGNAREKYKEFVKEHKNAKIYKINNGKFIDKTPSDMLGFLALNIPAEYVIIAEPQDPVTLATISAVISIGVGVYSYLAMRDVGDIDNKKSSNNTVGKRRNKARIGSRRPDIYGTQRAVPDLIAPPYRKFDENGVEFEESLMYISNGVLKIDKDSIKEGDTPISTIKNASCSIYPPRRPIDGDAFIQVGEKFDKKPIVAKMINSIDGRQKFKPSNDSDITTRNLVFYTQGRITGYNFSNEFNVGDTIKLQAEFSRRDNGNNFYADLSGEYEVTFVDDNSINLKDAQIVNPDWSTINDFTTRDEDITFSNTKNKHWLGWFYTTNENTLGFFANLVAPNGLSAGGSNYRVYFEMEMESLTNDGQPTGIVVNEKFDMVGDPSDRSRFGKTVGIKNEFLLTPIRFRIRRTNPHNGRASDVHDVVLDSAYFYSETKKTVYKKGTVCRLRRFATSSGKNESELNMIATRMLKTSSGFKATNDFAPIAYNIAINRGYQLGEMEAGKEISLKELEDLSKEIEQYFGTSKATEFNYTFDEDNISTEEMLATVAESVFCTARRDAGKTVFVFEKKTDESLLLFNHRSIKPETLKTQINYGVTDDYDGIQLKYKSAETNYKDRTIKIPNSNKRKYRTINTKGITNLEQAKLLAWRSYNKMIHANRIVEFDCYGEGDLVTRSDRIEVDDVNSIVKNSGEVLAYKNGNLYLSESVDINLSIDNYIHLQTVNNVEVIKIIGRLSDKIIAIASPPASPLVSSNFNSTYVITNDNSNQSRPYIIDEKSTGGLFESSIKAYNYDDRYYKNDFDFK